LKESVRVMRCIGGCPYELSYGEVPILQNIVLVPIYPWIVRVRNI
jgi:hypothetical protein